MDPGGALPPGVATACRPLVEGLLAVLDDPGTGVRPGSARHVWVELDLLGPVPEATALAVRPRLTGTARLGAADGLWLDVDVDGPAGAVLRSRHVVSARLDRPPDGRRALPRPDRRTTAAGGGRRRPLHLGGARVDAYLRGAADTSAVHGDAPTRIAPGLLVVLAAVAAGGVEVARPCRVWARFAHPLAVDDEATVVVDDDGAGAVALRVEAGGRTVIRDAGVGPVPRGGRDREGGRR